MLTFFTVTVLLLCSASWATSWQNLLLSYANIKGADQPAHARSLISAVVVPYLDSIIPLVSISKISSLDLASLAAQVSLCLTWSQTPKTSFLVTRLNLNFYHWPDYLYVRHSETDDNWEIILVISSQKRTLWVLIRIALPRQTYVVGAH